MAKQNDKKSEDSRFYRTVAEHSEIPSEWKYGQLATAKLKEDLREQVDQLEEDKHGNLIARINGNKNLGTILLSAHHDKVIPGTELGSITNAIEGDNIFFIDAQTRKKTKERKPFYFDPSKGYVYFSISNETEKIYDANKEETFPDQYGKPMIKKLIGEKGRRANCIGEKENRPFWGLPKFQEEPKTVSGKLDDSLGMAIMLELTRTLDRDRVPSLELLFTSGEEWGSLGAKEFIGSSYWEKIREETRSIINIDVTQCISPGEGVVIYQDCINAKKERKSIKEEPREPLVRELSKFADKQNIPYQIWTSRVNDARILAKTGVKTTCLEIPITGMHTDNETANKEDISHARNLIRKYLEGGLNV